MNMVENKKYITFDKLILKVVLEEINDRGRLTTFSAIVNEALAEKFRTKLKELESKELELKGRK